jgi:hypothetical protein
MSRISWSLPVLALLALGTAAGCQPDSPDQRADPSSSPTTTTAAAKPTPTPTAKDGTDLSACADGSCEIEVRAGQQVATPAGMGMKSLKVTRIASDRVELAGQGTGGGSGGCYGNPPCSVANKGGAITMTLGRTATAVMNDSALTIDSIGDGTAIISVEPA